jgi:hypothetical protein
LTFGVASALGDASARFVPVDPGGTMLHFTVGFLVFMLFYFVVMIFAEPYLRW